MLLLRIKLPGLLFLCILSVRICAQQNILQYVNPFIGTTTSGVFTKWGNAGGTYPGAVAPSGYMQLTPETSISGMHGYDYKDSSIYFFSCLHHLSGYPEGSAGGLYVMPVQASLPFELYTYKRPFSHKHEAAQAGYYSVTFTDDNTVVEATASQKTGIFRFSFPAHTIPKIFVGDAGRVIQQSKQLLFASNYNAAIETSVDIAQIDSVKGGYVFSFSNNGWQATVITVGISASSINCESAVRNIQFETTGLGFDAVKEKTQKQWLKLLQVVELNDTNITNKTIFYTALYHSLLLPWVTSDVDGNYRGKDGNVHRTKGLNEYGAFSPWDTYRTLHPLLTLLYPEKQRDVILSMLDEYNQTGYLPAGPMTGNHFIEVIADAYLKGVTGFDSTLAYTAMMKSIVDGPFVEDDMAVYNRQGYVPFTYPESVTRTVEYAYDDWVLSQYAKKVMHNATDYNMLLKRSNGYGQLFNKGESLLLPRSGDTFKPNPGTSGYKEGDAWVYTFSVPHNPVDLINLLGGNEEFSHILDDALATQRTVFDNETVFHVPYLFNYAGHAWLAQKWVRNFMGSRFANTPGGLPGNDDLGSFSSWYVFSAMGLFPACPGSPAYEIGSPIFRKVTLQLPNGRLLTIIANNTSRGSVYVKSLTVNGEKYTRHYITHAQLAAGGKLDFTMENAAAKGLFTNDMFDTVSMVHEQVNIKAQGFAVTKNTVAPDELFWVHVALQNNGGRGTHTIRLFVNGKEYAHKNCFVEAHAAIEDSISCRLYPAGNITITVDGLVAQTLTVVQEKGKKTMPFIYDVHLKPLVRLGDTQHVTYAVQNKSAYTQHFSFPFYLDDSIHKVIKVLLNAGENKYFSEDIPATTKGFSWVWTYSKSTMYKVYESNKDALMLNLQFNALRGDSMVWDASRFENNGAIVNTASIQKQNGRLHLGSNCYVTVPHSASADSLGEALTMMAWVYPETTNPGLTDIFSKGDNHVLQLAGTDKLTFFAGGWGRGDCTVNLPASWLRNWHHIAGVCTGDTLHVYIDGVLQGTSVVDGRPNLTVQSQWQIGRNEEFPGQRIFTGYVDKAKVFGAALSAADIREIVDAEKSSF